MTVQELITQLSGLPSHLTVITDLHSEWTEISGSTLIEGYENGGYISRPYDDRGKHRTHLYVHIS